MKKASKVMHCVAEARTKTEWLKNLEATLRKEYGIGIDDCLGQDGAEQCFDQGETVIETVRWIAEKRDLVPITTGYLFQ
jgi:hypothetical protein